jgi:hypothetical protein
MIAASRDKGLTWSYPIASDGILPNHYEGNGLFNSVSCSGRFCAAGGSYDDAVGKYPLIAISNDNGLNWQYTMDTKALPLPSNDSFRSEIKAISCNSNICIAGGYSMYFGKSYPMSLTSHDDGKTWSYPMDSASDLQPSNIATNGVIDGAS